MPIRIQGKNRKIGGRNDNAFEEGDCFHFPLKFKIDLDVDSPKLGNHVTF